MAVYKDNATGTWRVIYRFTNWKGERKQTQKRGFATKREAQAWEHEAMLKQGAKLDMTFGSFFEVYEADKKQRVKESTWESKSHVIRTKILPYFENRKIAEIEAKDVIAWQNELMAYKDEKGKPYSADYLRTIHAQLTAIFNHAVNFYNLPYNPARRAGTIGSEAVKEMDFWTKEEYLKFSEAMMDKPRSYYAFEIPHLLRYPGRSSHTGRGSAGVSFRFPAACLTSGFSACPYPFSALPPVERGGGTFPGRQPALFPEWP